MDAKVQSNDVEAIDANDAEQILEQFVSEGELMERLNFEGDGTSGSGGYC
jgi:hypothetical protein